MFCGPERLRRASSTGRSRQADRRLMTTTVPTEILPAVGFDRLRMASAAYLARYKGQSRVHTESDLRAYLYWCAERGLDPLGATRPHIELYVRWMQEQRRSAASTVSRRMAVVAGFYRTCVIDGVLQHSPAEYVRRPNVPCLLYTSDAADEEDSVDLGGRRIIK